MPSVYIFWQNIAMHQTWLTKVTLVLRYCSMSAAFDTVDHSLLIERTQTTVWNRRQCSKLSGGVPQQPETGGRRWQDCVGCHLRKIPSTSTSASRSQCLSCETWECGSTPSYQCARTFLGWHRRVFSALYDGTSRVTV